MPSTARTRQFGKPDATEHEHGLPSSRPTNGNNGDRGCAASPSRAAACLTSANRMADRKDIERCVNHHRCRNGPSAAIGRCAWKSASRIGTKSRRGWRQQPCAASLGQSY